MKKAKFQKSLSVSLPIAVYEKIKELSDAREVSMGEIARELLGREIFDPEDNKYERYTKICS
jgi:hypothetical protein